MQALAPHQRPFFEGLAAAQRDAGQEIALVELLGYLQQAGALPAGLQPAVGMLAHFGEYLLKLAHIQPGIAVRVELHGVGGDQEKGRCAARLPGEIPGLAGLAQRLPEVVERLAQAVAGLRFAHLGPEQPRQSFPLVGLRAFHCQVGQQGAHLGRLQPLQRAAVQGELHRSQQRDGTARHGPSLDCGWLNGHIIIVSNGVKCNGNCMD